MDNIERNAERFIELLENGKFKKQGITDREQYGATKEYTHSQQVRDLERYKYFINTSAYDDVKSVKVKVYKGDNQY